MTSPLVSVLMVTYNREPYLRQGVEAVLAQSLQDFELIMVDDCSPDGTWDAMQKYRGHPKIQLHRNEKNLGEYATRNLAASLAKGKYLKYCDAEDILYPHCLQVMAANLESFPDAGAGISRNVDQRFICPVYLAPAEVYRCQYLGATVTGRGLNEAIIRADAFGKSGGFDVRFRGADSALWMKLCQKRGLVIMVNGLSWGRDHPNQSSEILLKTGLSDFETFIWSRELLSDPACPLDASERKMAIANLERRFSRAFLRLAVSSQWAQAYRFWSGSGLGIKALAAAFRKPSFPYACRKHFDGRSPMPPNWETYSLPRRGGTPDEP